MTPKIALARDLGIDVKCLVGTSGQVHDCKVITPLPADKAKADLEALFGRK